MTCSRLLILGAWGAGALLCTDALFGTVAQVAAQPAATAKPATAAPKPAASAAPAAGKAAPAPAGKAGAAAPAAKAGAAAKPVAPVKYPFGLSEPSLRNPRSQVQLAGPAPRDGHEGDVLPPGQRVSTGPASGTDVLFADGTRITLSESTELSLYGVAPPPPAPGKKAAPFKPTTTTLHGGQVVVSVPAPAPPAAAAVPGKAPAKAPPPPKQPASGIVATPVGKVTVSPGSEVRISISADGVTRVAAYRGQAQIVGAKGGKPVVVQAGSGSRIADAKTPPVAPVPLPAAPVLAGTQQIVFSTGGPVDVAGAYGPGAAGDAPAQWHVQVASDETFEHIVSDARAGAAQTRIFSQPIGPGTYYVRASALNAEGAEGPMSAPARVIVAGVTVKPSTTGKRAAVAVTPAGLYCGLDGAELVPPGAGLPLAPLAEHTLRCATRAQGATAAESAELKLSAAQSGPFMAEVTAGEPRFAPAPLPPPDPAAKKKKDEPVQIEGQRDVTLSLTDAEGGPLTVAAISAEVAAPARADAVRPGTTPGSYVTTVHWPAGQTGLVLRYVISGTERHEAPLPDALPPVAAAEQPAESAQPAGTPKRFAAELGLFPLVHIDTARTVFGVGAGLEFGGRVRLPYGALAFALRPQYEYFAGAPGGAHLIVTGLPITYRIRKNIEADIVPYLGILPQFLAEYGFLSQDGVAGQGEWRTSFALGGLAGTEFRVRHGAVFVEGGYRHVLTREVPDYFPSLHGVFANVGFRATF